MTLSGQLSQERYITRAAASLPQTATTTFFNVTGMVEITGIYLIVTTAVQAQANAIKWRYTPTGGSVGDISGTVDINGAVVTSVIVAQGPTTAGAVSQALTLVQTTGATGKTLGNGTGTIVLTQSGAIGLNAAASSTGAVSAVLTYKSIAGGKVAAA